MEFIAKVNCCHCDAPSYINYGDMNDDCGVDPEGFICWRCKGHTVIDMMGELEKVNDHGKDCDCDVGFKELK
jgi:hypothetical protein